MYEMVLIYASLDNDHPIISSSILQLHLTNALIINQHISLSTICTSEESDNTKIAL